MRLLSRNPQNMKIHLRALLRRPHSQREQHGENCHQPSRILPETSLTHARRHIINNNLLRIHKPRQLLNEHRSQQFRIRVPPHSHPVCLAIEMAEHGLISLHRLFVERVIELHEAAHHDIRDGTPFAFAVFSKIGNSSKASSAGERTLAWIVSLMTRRKNLPLQTPRPRI